MKIARDKENAFYPIRVNEVLQVVPFGLVTRPAVGILRSEIGHDRGKDHLPGGGGSEQPILQPLELAGGSQVFAVEHALVRVVGIVLVVTLTPAIEDKEIR